MPFFFCRFFLFLAVLASCSSRFLSRSSCHFASASGSAVASTSYTSGSGASSAALSFGWFFFAFSISRTAASVSAECMKLALCVSIWSTKPRPLLFISSPTTLPLSACNSFCSMASVYLAESRRSSSALPKKMFWRRTFPL